MEYVNIIIPFVGGLGMFIYGMQIMAQGLENALNLCLSNNKITVICGSLYLYCEYFRIFPDGIDKIRCK